MKKRIKNRKRHFLLLELMVAAFILLICIAPTMRIFTSIFQEQQEIIRENQGDHIAHLVHAIVTERLYKHEIKFSEDTKAEAIPLSDTDLQKELDKYGYTVQAALTIIESVKHKEENHPNKYLAQLVIKLIDTSPKAESRAKAQNFINQDPHDTFYDYIIYIDAGAKEKKDSNKGKSNEEEDDDDDLSDDEDTPQNSNANKKKTGFANELPPKPRIKGTEFLK